MNHPPTHASFLWPEAGTYLNTCLSFLLMRSYLTPQSICPCVKSTHFDPLFCMLTRYTGCQWRRPAHTHTHASGRIPELRTYFYIHAEATEQRALKIFTRFHANIVCLKPRALFPVIGCVSHTVRHSDSKKLQEERNTRVPKPTPRPRRRI